MEKKNLDIESNIQFLKGVGPAKAALFNNIGIYKIKDLIEYYPRCYEDRTKLKLISEFQNGENALFIGTVNADVQVQRIRKNLSIYTTFVSDETGICKITWFNQTYIKDKVKEGMNFLFFGKTILINGHFSIDSPEIYNISELKKIQGIYPIYSLTAGITQNYIFKQVINAYENKSLTNDLFSEYFRNRYDLVEINYAMKNIHFPKSFTAVNIARRRLIFEELFLLELALTKVKDANIIKEKDNKFKNINITPFLNLLPFTLTNSQQKVIAEITKDLLSNKVMNRLVQGDVGSGKTMVAAVAMYIAAKNGYQSSLMVPTTILANQHYVELKKYFDILKINVDIITSSTTKKNKSIIAEKLKNKEIDIIIGTHSLLEDNIEFNNLGLVITDEQHRFGVKQRMKLSSKGKNIDTLVMTATPIPRTLAIMLYGDLDLSIIDELPAGRTPIKTFVVDETYDKRINLFIEKQINSGRQIYVVCPLVEENDNLDLKSVGKIYKKYKEDIFSKYSVSFIHGKMKNKEKDEIMNKFKDNKINILVSTTVIEVGISVSNATVMVIENADRFGLAALHQLRGRVGRGSFESYCILKSDNKSINSKKRLNIMKNSNNGFEIAQKDLELRGPGDFFGIRQSGLPEFKLANLLTDVELVKEAQDAVEFIEKTDKELKLKENIYLKEALFEKFGEQLSEATHN